MRIRRRLLVMSACIKSRCSNEAALDSLESGESASCSSHAEEQARCEPRACALERELDAAVPACRRLTAATQLVSRPRDFEDAVSFPVVLLSCRPHVCEPRART